MGFALPAAIGAKVARPDAEVWVVVGDGGFQMTMPELATIAQEQLEVNDRHHQQRLPRHGAPVAGVLLRAPLRRHAAAQPRLREARRGLRLAARAITARPRSCRRRRGARASGHRRLDFQVEQEDSVYPMVPAGADLHEMIRRPSPLVETAEDA
jgi:acetolactate synthase I/II/III large subunit